MRCRGGRVGGQNNRGNEEETRRGGDAKYSGNTHRGT